MIYKNYNSANDLKIIKLANELIEYKAHHIRKDKYYGLISRELIKEICWNNKAVLNGIKNKRKLDIEEYRELLNAIGYLMYDYCKSKMYGHCQRIEYECMGYDFVSDFPLIDYAMGKYDNEFRWYLKSSKNKISLIKFKYNKNGEMIMYKGNNAEYIITDARCEQIGKLKVFISDDNKKVYCQSIDNELLYVVKDSDNKYYWQNRSA